MVQQVGGEAVSQAVRADPGRVDPRSRRVPLHQRPERLPGGWDTVGLQEQRRRRATPGQHWTRFGQIPLQPVLRLLAQGHQTVLAALAGHPQHALAQVHRRRRQTDQFAHAQAGGVHQFQHRAVAQADGAGHVGCRQQGLDVALAQRLGQRARQLRRIEQRGRVVGALAAPHAQGEERAQRRQQAGVAARRIALPRAPGKVVEQHRAIRAGQAAARTVAPACQALQVAAIAGLGLLGQPGLGPDRLDEIMDRGRIGIAQRRQRHGAGAALGGRGRGRRRRGSRRGHVHSVPRAPQRPVILSR